jgi:hypothetical protein
VFDGVQVGVNLTCLVWTKGEDDLHDY